MEKSLCFQSRLYLLFSENLFRNGICLLCIAAPLFFRNMIPGYSVNCLPYAVNFRNAPEEEAVLHIPQGRAHSCAGSSGNADCLLVKHSRFGPMYHPAVTVMIQKGFHCTGGINGHLRQKGKIAELACGYGGSVGAMKAMGAQEMGLSDDEIQQIVTDWRDASPNIVKLWWDVDRAVKKCIKEKTEANVKGLHIFCESGFLFIELPSGRRLAYVKPKIGENKFGGESVTYMGVGEQKKWERIESYGPKFVENIIQGIARDILLHAMMNLRDYRIVAHVHDEVIIEATDDITVDEIVQKMCITPRWARGLTLRADGYECEFYMKD